AGAAAWQPRSSRTWGYGEAQEPQARAGSGGRAAAAHARRSDTGGRSWIPLRAAEPRMTDPYASSGQDVNVSPVASSTSTTRASATPLPTQSRNLLRAVDSSGHQPCWTGRPADARVRWERVVPAGFRAADRVRGRWRRSPP